MLDVFEYLKKDQDLKNLKHTLIFGEDIYFIHYFENQLKSKFKTKTYYADEIDYDKLKELIFSKSIFSQKEAIIFKNAKYLVSLLKGKKLDISNIRNILIFEEYDELSDKDIKTFKDIFGDIAILTSKQKSKDFFRSIIYKKFKKENIELSKDIIDYIIDTIGLDSLNLKNETDKLLIASKSIPMTKDNISKILVREPKDEVFSLVDALLKKNVKKALNILDDAIRLGQHPIMMFGFISKQFVNMYLAFKINKNFDEVCKILGISTPFQKNILKKQMDMISKDKLPIIIRLLKKADMDIKYYFNDPEKVLKDLIINVWMHLKDER